MYSISKLPFFFKSHNDKNNGGFPPTLNFELYYDDQLKMFRQKPYPELIQLLNQVYTIGSLGEGSISGESGEIYVDRIVEYILSKISTGSNPEVLEIGYGSGIILRKLKENGLSSLTGIEPGMHKEVNGLENINLVRDFFPTPQLVQRFDLIYALLVLEHMPDPVLFVSNLAKHLNRNGKIILAVPNCEEYLEHGDISILIHEHFSYFTRESIYCLAQLTGLHVEEIIIIEGAFIFTLANSQEKPNKKNEGHIPAQAFLQQIELHIDSIKHIFSSYKQADIVVYAPIRALNALFITGNTSCRLADDSNELTGKYLPTLERPIENFDALIAHPPLCILIFSRTFGDRIKNKCLREEKLSGTKIISLSELSNQKIRYE